MAEVTLLPGAVFMGGGTPGGALPPVGPPPQWADGDDATYATVQQNDTSGIDAFPSAYLDPFSFPADPVSLVYHARVASAPDSTSTGQRFEMGVLSDDFTVFMLGVDTQLYGYPTAIATWFASDPIPIPDPAAFSTASEAGALRTSFALATSELSAAVNKARIYEAHIVVTYGGSEPPTTVAVTHLWPRKDNRGPMGSADIIYPYPGGGHIFPFAN